MTREIIQEIIIALLGLALVYAVYRDARQCRELERQDKLIARLRERIRELTPGNTCCMCGRPAPYSMGVNGVNYPMCRECYHQHAVNTIKARDGADAS